MGDRSQPHARTTKLATRLVGGPVLLATLAAAALLAGCSVAAHHRVLAFFFDGVPDPNAIAVVSAGPDIQASVGRRLVRPGEHGPYAAKLCDACHNSKATNALVVPAEQLCKRCHELGVAKKYVHGPLASGGCLVCHDPHSSANRFLLVSASDGFCLHCHDRGDLSAVDGHAGDLANCTDCHEAHMSDRKYLLR